MIDNSPLIVTYLWRDNKFKFRDKFQYKPEHVIALYRQLKKHLHIPFYFTVVTDEAMLPGMDRWASDFRFPSTGLNNAVDPDLNRIDVYRIWDDYKDMGRCWRRLRGFSALEFGHLSKVLFIDLDMMILDDITPLIKDNWDHPFVMADDSACGSSKYNGSFIMFTPTPTTHKLWKTFDENPEVCKRLISERGWQGSDQAWIRLYMDEIVHQPIKTIGTEDGLYSFRWHCRDQGINPFDAGAKMVNFHGPWMPDMPEIKEQYSWTQVYDSFNFKPKVKPEVDGRGKHPNSHKTKIKMTPEKLRGSIKILERGGVNRHVAEYVGCHRSQVSCYLKQFPELLEAKIKGAHLRDRKSSFDGEHALAIKAAQIQNKNV